MAVWLASVLLLFLILHYNADLWGRLFNQTKFTTLKILLSCKCCKSICKTFSKLQKEAFHLKTDHKKNTSTW